MAGDGIDDGERIAEKSIETIDADEDIKWNVGGIKRKTDGWANNPENVKENSIERGIARGRFLPLKYFVERAYKRAQGKVEKIENELKTKYGEKLTTKYIDSTENNPIVVSPNEALAWDYSVSQEQLRKIEEITNENIGRIEESARLRKDKKNPLAVITSGLQEVNGILVYRNVSFERIVSERISGRDKQGNEGNQRGVERQRNGGETSHLKSLLRQERGGRNFALKAPQGEYVYTSLFDILGHHFNRRHELNETSYFNSPNVIFDTDIAAKEKIENSYIFGMYLDRILRQTPKT